VLPSGCICNDAPLSAAGGAIAEFVDGVDFGDPRSAKAEIYENPKRFSGKLGTFTKSKI
jgi:hypothetical protein